MVFLVTQNSDIYPIIKLQIAITKSPLTWRLYKESPGLKRNIPTHGLDIPVSSNPGLLCTR